MACTLPEVDSWMPMAQHITRTQLIWSAQVSGGTGTCELPMPDRTALAEAGREAT